MLLVSRHLGVSWLALRNKLYVLIIIFDCVFNSCLVLLQVRQLAAVEMRKRVAQNSGNLWMLLPQAEREQIKAKLPELILAEPRYV
jgi:Importin-beta N-terminal domain.